MSDIFAALAAQARQAEENPTGYVNPLQRMREAEARNAAIMEERKQQMAQFALAERAALEPSPPIKTALDIVQDVGVSALASTVGFWQMGVGLADLGIAAGQAAYAGVTGEPMGKTGVLGNWLENNTPVRLKEAAAAINAMHSDAYKYQLEQFRNMPGVTQDGTASENLSNFGDMLGYLAANPTVPIGTTVESAPQMFAGGLLGRGLTALAPRVFGTALTGEAAVAAAAAEAPLVKAGLKASAVGEGLTMAGAQQENIRSQTQDGFTTGQQSGLAAVTGGAGGLIAAASGGLGRRIGLEDADMLLMGNSNAASKLPGAVRYPGTMLKEGIIEEAPQTALETVNENAALDRPLDHQLGQNTAQGVAAGVLTAGVLQAPHSGKEMLGEAASAAGKVTKTNDFGKLSDINDKAYDPTRAVSVRKADLSSSDEAVRTAAQQDINTMTTTLAEARDKMQQRKELLARTMESLVELRDLVSGIDPQTTDPDEQTLLQQAQNKLSTLPQVVAEAKSTQGQLDAYDKHLNNLERAQSSWVSTQVPAAPTPAEAAQIVATASGQGVAAQNTSSAPTSTTTTSTAASAPNGNLFTDDSFVVPDDLPDEDKSRATELMLALKAGRSLGEAILYIAERDASLSPDGDRNVHAEGIRNLAGRIIRPEVLKDYLEQSLGQPPSAAQNTASATGSAEAAKNAVNEMLLHPASYTVEDLSTVLSSGFDMLEPEQVSMLRILSEARQAQNLSKNPDAVSSQVLNGDKEERYKSIQEYVSIYAKAMRTGNTALADMQVRKAVAWAKQYAQKAAAALEAYDQYEKTSEPQVVYRTKDGQWTYTKQGKLKQENTRPMGALIINGKSENLINSIYQDATVVGQAATALQRLDAKNRGATAPAAAPAVQPQPSAPQPTAPPVAAAPASTPAPAAPKQPAVQPAQQTPSSTPAPAPTATAEAQPSKTLDQKILERSKRQYAPKDANKAKGATGFIGKGTKGSDTALYAELAAELVPFGFKTKDFTANDRVFVSANGKRPNRVPVTLETWPELKQALEAGATIVADKPTDRNDRDYNVGERELAVILENSGYVESNKDGVWTKAQQDSPASDTKEEPSQKEPAPPREEPKKASAPDAEPVELMDFDLILDPTDSPEEPADPVEQPQQEPAEEAQTTQPEEQAADSEQAPKQPKLSGKVIKAIYNLQALNDDFIFDALPESWNTVGSDSPQDVLTGLPQLERELAAMPEDNQTANEMRRLIQEIRKAQAEQNEAQEEDQAAEQPAKTAAQEPTPLQEGGGLAVLKIDDEQRAKERLKPVTSQNAGAISRLQTKLKKADATLEDVIKALESDFAKSKSEQAKSSIKIAISIAREYESVEEAQRGLAARQRAERRNQAKAHLVQTSSESQPLSYEEGFLTKNSLEALVAKTTFMIGREVTDGELALLTKLREFHEKMKGISGKIAVSKEFIQTNLINYFRSDIDDLLSGSDVAPNAEAQFEDNLISAITLAAYSQIQRNSSKKVMKDSEINEILGRKAEAPVSNEERKFFSRPVLDKFAVINELGSDIMKMLGLKLHKDAPAHLHDGFIKALGGTAFSMMEAAHVIKPSSWEAGWERAAINAEGDLSVKLLQILANEYKRTNSVETTAEQLVIQALQNINKGAKDPLLDFLDNPGASANDLKAKFNALPYYETNINDALGESLRAEGFEQVPIKSESLVKYTKVDDVSQHDRLYKKDGSLVSDRTITQYEGGVNEYGEPFTLKIIRDNQNGKVFEIQKIYSDGLVERLDGGMPSSDAKIIQNLESVADVLPNPTPVRPTKIANRPAPIAPTPIPDALGADLGAFSLKDGLFLTQLFGSKIGSGVPRTSPNTEVDSNISKSFAGMSTKQKEAILSAQQNAFVLRKDVVAAVRGMVGNTQLLRAFMKADPNAPELIDVSTVAPFEREGTREAHVNNMQEILKNLEFIDTLESEDVRLFLDIWASANNRMYYDSSVLNPMSSKISRAMMAMEAFSTEVKIPPLGSETARDIGPEGEHHYYRLWLKAVGLQAEGLYKWASLKQKAEKSSEDEFVDAFHVMLQKDSRITAAVEAFNLLQENQELSPEQTQALIDFAAAADTGPMALMALGEISKMHAAMEGKGTFVSQIMTDSDGINNGMAIARALYGLPIPKKGSIDYEVMAALGMYYTDSGISTSFEANKQYSDFYSIIANGVRGSLELFEKYVKATLKAYSKDATEADKAAAKTSQTLAKAFAKKLIESYVLTKNPTEEQVSKAADMLLRDTARVIQAGIPLQSRDTAKIWTIPFIYGAGYRSLKRALGTGFAERVQQDIFKKALKLHASNLSEDEKTPVSAALETQRDSLGKLIYPKGIPDSFMPLTDKLLDWQLTADEQRALVAAVSSSIGLFYQDSTEKIAAQHSVIRQINLSKIEASGEMFRFLHKWTRIAAKQQMLKEAEGREDSGIFSYDGIWNDLTVRQEKVLARNLMRYSPFQRSAMSTSESSWKAGLQNGISMFEQSEDTLSLAEQEPVLLDVTTIKRDGTVSEPGSVGTTRIGFGPKQMDSVSILGGSRQIQGTDAAVTTEVIGALPALNMHDSNGTGLDKAEEMAKLQNQTFVDTVLNYMPGIETIESLSRVFEGIVKFLPLLHKTAVEMDKLSEFRTELTKIGFIYPGDPESFRNGFALAGGTPEADLLRADSNKLENFKVLGHVHQYAGEYGEWVNPLHVNTSLLSEEARKEAEASKKAFEEKLAALKEDLDQRTTKLATRNSGLLNKLYGFAAILEERDTPKKGLEDAVPFLATDAEIEALLNSLTKGVQLDSAVGTLLEDRLKTGKDQTVSYTDLLDVLVEQEDLLPVTIKPAYDILNAVRERFPRGLKVQLLSKKEMEDRYGVYRGIYDARENKVFLVPQKSSDVFVELVVHELLHAVSQHTVTLAEEGKLDARGMVAYRRLEKLFETYQNIRNPVKEVNNIHEFIAYGLSNTHVINQLAGKMVSRDGRDKKGFAILARIKSSVASIIKTLQNFFGFNQDTADEITAQAALAYDVLDMLTHPQMVRDSHFMTYDNGISGKAEPYAVTLNGVKYTAKKQTYVVAEGSGLENFGKLVATNLTRLHKQIMQDGTQDADGNPSGIFSFYNEKTRQSLNLQVTFKVSEDELTVLIDQAPDYLTSRNSLLWQKAMQPAPQKGTAAEKSSPLPMVSQPNGNTSSLEMFEGLEAGRTSSDFQKHLSDVMDQMLYSFGVHEQDVQDQINNMVPPQHTAAVAAGFVLSDREAYAVTALETVLEGIFNLNQHAATLAAMRKGFETARKTLTVESFHEGDWNQATRAEKALAQSRYDYLFALKRTGGKHTYLSRFLALALGSEQMNQMLDITLPKEAPSKKSWGARLIAAYQSLLDWVLNRNAGIRPSTPINTQLQKLTEKLVQLEVQKRNSNATRVDRAFSVLDDAGAWVGKKTSALIGKTAKALPDNKVTKPLKQVVDILQSDRLDALQEAITGLRNEMFPNTPAGTGKMLLNELMKPGALLKELEKYTRQTTLLAQSRDTLKTAAMRSLYSKFESSGVTLDDKTKSAVAYGLLRTDVQSLVAHMPMEDVLKMVTSQKARQARIQTLEKQVLGYAHGAHKLMRAKDLAHYLNTNEGHMLLAKNAEVIAKGIGTHYQKDTQENASPDEIAALDQLATLYALDRFKHPGKAELMKLVQNAPAALEFTLKLHQSLVSQGQRLFVDNPLSFRKGYLPDLSHPNRVVGIVTPGESGQVLGQGAVNLELSGNVQQLQKEGWQVIGLLEQHPSDKGPQKVLLLHPDLGYQRYVSGTVDLLNPERMGVEVLDRTQREIIEANKARLAQSRAMEKIDYRNYTPETQPMGYIPAYDSEGYVMAYNYEMQASTRDVHLERNNDFIELLGTLQGMNVYKQDVIQHNQEVAEMVWNTYKENFRKNPKAFVALDPDSENPEIAQKWRMLPRSFREAATQLFGQENTIWVHSDMLNPLLGFKKWSLTNVFDSSHPGAKFLAQTFKGLLGNDIARARVARYEHAIQEIVGKMKNFIVIRSLTVLFNNILANTVVLLIKSKSNPLHLFKDMGTALVHSTQYMRDFAEAARLRTEIRAGNDTPENVRKLIIVEDKLERNPLKDFLQEGMLSSIVEDIEMSNNTLQYRSDFQEKVHTSLDKLPQGLRNIIEMIMVSPGTKPHQFLASMTQLSDFVAKYALYKAEMRAGAKHEDAVQTASDTFINYDIPTSPALQYANDMGLVMFTKFAIRIQHVLLDIARNNTGKMLIYTSLMAALTNAPSAMDPSWVNRAGSNPLEPSLFGFPGAMGDILPINVVMGMIF